MEFSIWQKVILNTILVSIPEEIYIVLFIVIMMKRFNVIESTVKNSLIKIRLSEVKKLLAGIVLIALILNIMRYNGVKIIIVFTIGLLFFVLLVLIVYGINSFEKIVKTFAAALLSLLTLVIIEGSYGPLVFSIIDKTAYEFNVNVFNNFLFIIPERFIMSLIIIYIMNKDFENLKRKLVKPILENNFLLMLTAVILAFTVITTSLLVSKLCLNEVMHKFDIILQTAIVAAVIVFPGIVILVYSYIVYRHIDRRRTKV